MTDAAWKPYFVEGDDPMQMHRKMADTLDQVMDEIKAIQKNARENHDTTRPKWPMIVLRTPKGWTGPKVVDGNQIEGSFRAHQVPIMMDKPEHLELLKNWLMSYHPEELFDETGKDFLTVFSVDNIKQFKVFVGMHLGACTWYKIFFVEKWRVTGQNSSG